MGAAGIVLLAVVTLVMARGAWRMYDKFSQAAAARQAGETRLAELTQELEQAKQGVAELGTSRGLEAEVRERYGLAKPGEGEIVVVRPEDKDGLGPPLPGFWERLWGMFFVW